MIHQPELERIPASLRPLRWKPMDAGREWLDGNMLLVAVPVRYQPDREPWRYEFSVVTIDCDEDRFRVTLDGELWGWELDDVDYYVEIR